MNKMNLSIFFILLIHKYLINCIPNNTIDNNVKKLIEIEFDLNNISPDDYIIKRNIYLPCGYQFIPKPDRKITNVKIEGRTVWSWRNSIFISDIIIYFHNSKDIKYSINLFDNEGNFDSIHYYHNLYLHAAGIMDYYQDVYLEWTTFKEKNTFDLNSPFDYRDHHTKIFESTDKLYRNVEVDIRGLHQIYELYDGKKLFYVTKELYTIKKLKYSWREGQKLLLRCSTDYFGKELIYFKYNNDNNNWEQINDDEYKDIYFLNKMFVANVKLEKMEVYCEYNLSLLDVISYLGSFENHRWIMGIPTIELTYNILQRITEGKQSLLKRVLKNAKVYLFRGEDSYEMIEIIHHITINTKTGQETRKENLKESMKIRGLNYYFIKEKGKWNEVSQSVFFHKFKKLVISNLEKINAKLLKSKPLCYENKIKNNKKLIKITNQLELIDNTERVETNVVDISDEAVITTRFTTGHKELNDKVKENKEKVSKLEKTLETSIFTPLQFKKLNLTGPEPDYNVSEQNSNEFKPTSQSTNKKPSAYMPNNVTNSEHPVHTDYKYSFSEPESMNDDEPDVKTKIKKILRINTAIAEAKDDTSNVDNSDETQEDKITQGKQNDKKNIGRKKSSFYELSIIGFIIFLLI